MSWRTNGWVLMLRNIGRRLGLNKLVVFYKATGVYEDEYDTALFDAIRTGDVIWDVGANVGYYTRKFSKQVLNFGSVFAFEPSPINFVQLTSSCASLSNVTLLQYGLGRENAKLCFQQGTDKLGATSRVVAAEATEQEVIDIDIKSGASLIDTSGIEIPNCIKIDVEGFELEVLQGIGKYIKSSEIRVVGVEVHFRILKERGLSSAPRQIEALLTDNGFSVSWPDSSHILAVRS